VIEEFRARFEQRHERSRKLREEGKRFIACFYGLVPKELVHAAGMVPVQLVEDRNPKFDEKSALLPYLCGMSKNVTGQIYDKVYDYVDGAMVATICDTNRKVFDIWKYRKALPNLWLVRIPLRETELALQYYTGELRRLAGELSAISGQEVTDESLSGSIKAYNESRDLFRRFYDLRPQSDISAEDALNVFFSALVTPVEEHNTLMSGLIESLPGTSSGSNGRTRLMLSAINFNMARDVIRMAEKYEAVIVTDDLINNSRFGLNPVAEDGDPFAALARGYLNRVPAPGMYPYEDRAVYIRDTMQKADASGLIYLLQLYCDAFAMEYGVIKERFEAWKLPHLKLEAEDTPSSLEQLNVRLQSFIESLL
jgi:benzoyl-CoA reductase/2-hydroxyglutaryl-CoA dehydratase subunit BcrC/BadD/HgdB